MAVGIDLNSEAPEGGEDTLPDLNEVAAGDEDGVEPGVFSWPAAVIQLPFDLNQTLEEEAAIPYDAEIGLDSELSLDLNAMVQDMEEYSVYGDAVNIDFDQEVLSSSDEDEPDDENGNQPSRGRNTTNRQRQDIYEALLESSTRGKLKKNSTRLVAQRFQVRQRTIQRIWDRAKKCRAQGQPVDVSSRLAKNSGRKKFQVDLSTVANIPLHKRSTIRKLAKELGVSKTSLHRWFKQGLVRRHSNALKPYLREENKKERLRWCMSMLDPTTLTNEPKFVEMDNIIHIDEKWFNATKKSKTFYMLPEEEDPHRTVQNKNSIDKVMILAAVARPRQDDEGNETFSGKIGVWPFVRKEPAKRTSRNRQRGTLVTKSVTVVRDTMRSYLISKVLPAIKEKWPREDRHRTIWIQQDNARTHVLVDDEQFATAAAQIGFDIRLMNQPPNSPDMNCLDLGFFASLQSLTYDTDSRNMDELIDNIVQKFNDYESNLITRVFLTLQSCLIKVMKVRGANRYKIPHLNKSRLESLGILPTRLTCDNQLYNDLVQFLEGSSES